MFLVSLSNWLPQKSQLSFSQQSFSMFLPSHLLRIHPSFSQSLSPSPAFAFNVYGRPIACPIVNSEMTLQIPLQLTYSHCCSLLFDLIH